MSSPLKTIVFGTTVLIVLEFSVEINTKPKYFYSAGLSKSTVSPPNPSELLSDLGRCNCTGSNKATH